MRLIEARKLIPAYFLIVLFIAKRLHFMQFNVYEMKDLIYLCFLYTGIADMGFNLIHVTDFFLYQCILIVFLGGFYRDDILSNQELLFTRAKKRKGLFQKGTIKLVLNTSILYVLLYGTSAMVLCYKNKTKTFDVMYFLYAMLFLVTYILLINVMTMLVDVKLFLVILLTVEVFIDNFIGIALGDKFFGVFQYLKNGMASNLPYALAPIVVAFILLNMIGIKIMKTREVV